jgi:hypothetical protein
VIRNEARIYRTLDWVLNQLLAFDYSQRFVMVDLKPDLVLVDAGMPLLNGLAAESKREFSCGRRPARWLIRLRQFLSPSSFPSCPHPLQAIPSQQPAARQQ